MKHLRNLRAGEWVEVRSKEEILATLDKNGRLEGLPFMPQMFSYCGQRFQIYKRAHKTCDTVNGTGGRRVSNAVHLTLRCDGNVFGGCPAGCLIFWKTAWLKPLRENLQTPEFMRRVRHSWCTEEDVDNSTTVADGQGGKRYVCQATQLPFYSSPLLWRDISQYVEDLVSRNTTIGEMAAGCVNAIATKIIEGGGPLARPAHRLYDWFKGLLKGGIPYPRRRGLIPPDAVTPIEPLNLQPGEMVRVKSYEQILATVTSSLTNRGLSFDPEMVPYCGQVHRVAARVETFVDENTGRQRTLKIPAVVLEGTVCKACYSKNRMFCPRSIRPWWREIWLERIDAATQRDINSAHTPGGT